jgi:LysR family transcriptional regulator, glycine cleavage system transcriptional activator
MQRIDGQGIALARTTLAAGDLTSGRLIRPFEQALRLFKLYWVVSPRTASMFPKVATFREWLLAEAARDVQRLQKLGTSRRQ